jgi:hypothetical protein
MKMMKFLRHNKPLTLAVTQGTFRSTKIPLFSDYIANIKLPQLSNLIINKYWNCNTHDHKRRLNCRWDDFDPFFIFVTPEVNQNYLYCFGAKGLNGVDAPYKSKNTKATLISLGKQILKTNQHKTAWTEILHGSFFYFNLLFGIYVFEIK